ncbi:MAG: hypothetical protein JNK24_08470 [Alphaproteobacteria bacterium]|nr:hypothetical protein [Alphaproteobacteria bacterium]
MNRVTYLPACSVVWDVDGTLYDIKNFLGISPALRGKFLAKALAAALPHITYARAHEISRKAHMGKGEILANVMACLDQSGLLSRDPRKIEKTRNQISEVFHGFYLSYLQQHQRSALFHHGKTFNEGLGRLNVRYHFGIATHSHMNGCVNGILGMMNIHHAFRRHACLDLSRFPRKDMSAQMVTACLKKLGNHGVRFFVDDNPQNLRQVDKADPTIITIWILPAESDVGSIERPPFVHHLCKGIPSVFECIESCAARAQEVVPERVVNL